MERSVEITNGRDGTLGISVNGVMLADGLGLDEAAVLACGLENDQLQRENEAERPAGGVTNG
jgi:hypothetical protein